MRSFTIIAAKNAPGLLEDAARVAQKRIVLLEDLNYSGNINMKSRNYNHDRNGIFRTHDEWMKLLHGTGFRVTAQGKMRFKPGYYYVAEASQVAR